MLAYLGLLAAVFAESGVRICSFVTVWDLMGFHPKQQDDLLILGFENGDPMQMIKKRTHKSRCTWSILPSAVGQRWRHWRPGAVTVLRFCRTWDGRMCYLRRRAGAIFGTVLSCLVTVTLTVRRPLGSSSRRPEPFHRGSWCDFSCVNMIMWRDRQQRAGCKGRRGGRASRPTAVADRDKIGAGRENKTRSNAFTWQEAMKISLPSDVVALFWGFYHVCDAQTWKQTE